jgi:hypothetical protein
MPSAYTSLLGFVQPVTGELTNTWGGTVNNQLTQLIEDSIATTSTASVTAGDWTLSTTAGGAQNEARTAILIATGTPGTARVVYAPKSSKTYVVINNSDSVLTLKGGPGSPTTGIALPAGGSVLAAWDSNVGDFVKVAGGGGGATGGGANEVFFENDQTVTNDYTIPGNKNAGTFGPITVDSGITVTVSTGAVWTIV